MPISACSFTETYGHDEVYILNAEDRPLYASAGAERRDLPALSSAARRLWGRDRGDTAGNKLKAMSRVPSSSASRISNYRKLAASLTKRRAGQGTSYPWTADRRSLQADHRAQHQQEFVEGHAQLLLSITYIDEAFISEIGRSLLLPDLGLLTAQPSHADGLRGLCR